MENPKRTNYILVDFENTQVIDLDLITGKPVKIILLIGDMPNATHRQSPFSAQTNPALV